MLEHGATFDTLAPGVDRAGDEEPRREIERLGRSLAAGVPCERAVDAEPRAARPWWCRVPKQADTRRGRVAAPRGHGEHGAELAVLPTRIADVVTSSERRRWPAKLRTIRAARPMRRRHCSSAIGFGNSEGEGRARGAR